MTCLVTLWTVERSSGPPSRLWVCEGSRPKEGPGWGFTVTRGWDWRGVALLLLTSRAGALFVRARDGGGARGRRPASGGGAGAGAASASAGHRPVSGDGSPGPGGGRG